MLALFAVTILVGSMLLFLVEPMFARMVLPRLGGSPAVWNTALVFYQLALLAGYGYVHWLSTRFRLRAQLALHFAVLLAATICLPIAIPPGWHPPSSANPIPSLLGLLALALGLPFFVVSTTGPLIQKWFAATRHRLAADPYFLYAASNVGSMVGLLSYPFLVEPRLSLDAQTHAWGLGYGLLAALTAVCAVLALRGGAGAASHGIVPESPGESFPARRRLRWMLLAFAPSSLMMGVTSHITTDVAAIPLLWVLPLALYLFSFVIVFSRRPLLPHGLAVRAFPLIVLPLLVIMVGRPAQPILLIMGLHLLTLFAGAMVCHGELARDRPSAERLTEFYLWIAIGGALGGVFNALIAPIAFDTILEYPLAIALVCLLRPAKPSDRAGAGGRVLDLALPAIIALLMVGTTVGLIASRSQATRPITVLLVTALTFPVLAFSRRRPLRFGLAVAAILLANPAEIDQRTRGLHAERSFFGLHRVLPDPSGKFHLLYNGSTLHGIQRVNPPGCREPLGYYSAAGPLGDIFRAARAQRVVRSVAVGGLGAGGIASYARPGERWTYFEIDPVVARIAGTSRLFCYLQAAPAPVRVVLGDARMSLAASRERFDVIVLDAYSSDAIPVHLLTKEAFRLYLDRLSDGGLLAFHISNKFFRLAPVVARLARDAGLECRVRRSGRVTDAETAAGIFPSVYAVVARRPRDLGTIAQDPRWVNEPSSVAPLWTDQFSSLLSVLRH